MAFPEPDRDAYAAAGGNLDRVDLIAQVGRVATFGIDQHRIVASLHPERPEIGAVADWRGGVEVLQAAEAWLAAQGCTHVRGPMWLTPWLDHAANLGPFEVEPLLFEPTEPGDRWEPAGYSVRVRYVSIRASHGQNITAGMDAAATLGSRGWRLETLDLRGDYDNAMALMHEVLHRAHAPTRGYVPVPAGVWADWYRRRVPELLDPSLTRLARTPQGEPAGVVLAYPDRDPRQFQLQTLAVVPEHRHVGLASWMVAHVHQTAQRAGFELGIHTMVRHGDNRPPDTPWYRGDVIRRYADFGKPIR